MLKILLSSLFLALLFSHILVIDPTTQLIGDGGDTYEYLTFMSLTKDNLAILKYPFSYTDTLRYPVGFHFEYGFDGAFAVLTGSLLMFLLPPLTAYNLTVLLIIFLNLFISILVFARLAELQQQKKTVAFLKGVLAGIIFGTSPFVLARLNGHLNLTLVAGFPLLAYSVITIIRNFWKGDNSDRLASLLWGLFLISLGSLQYVVLVSWLVILTIPIFLIYIQRQGKLRMFLTFIFQSIKASLAEITIFAGARLFLFGGYLAALFRKELILNRGFAPDTKLLDLLIPNQYLWPQFSLTSTNIEGVVSVGVIGLLIMALYLFSRPLLSAKKTVVFLSLLLLSLLSLGVVFIPFYTEASRLVVLTSLIVALVICLDTKFLQNLAVLLVLIILATAERLTYDIKFVSPPTAELSAISSLPGKTILAVPLSTSSPIRGLIPVFTKKKILDGYFHYTADDQRSRMFLEKTFISIFSCENDSPQNLSPEEITSFLKFYDILTALLVKSDPQLNFFSPQCSQVREVTRQLVNSGKFKFERTGNFGDVYKVN